MAEVGGASAPTPGHGLWVPDARRGRRGRASGIDVAAAAVAATALAASALAFASATLAAVARAVSSAARREAVLAGMTQGCTERCCRLHSEVVARSYCPQGADQQQTHASGLLLGPGAWAPRQPAVKCLVVRGDVVVMTSDDSEYTYVLRPHRDARGGDPPLAIPMVSSALDIPNAVYLPSYESSGQTR